MTQAERRQLAAKRITKIYEVHGLAMNGGVSTRGKQVGRTQQHQRPLNQQSKSTNPRTRQKLLMTNVRNNTTNMANSDLMQVNEDSIMSQLSIE